MSNKFRLSVKFRFWGLKAGVLPRLTTRPARGEAATTVYYKNVYNLEEEACE